MSHDPRRATRHHRVAYRSHYRGAMRLLGLSLFALVGCAETGAHLTLATSPDGPTTATSFRVVLAAYDQFPEVRNQRVAPGDRTSIHVKYFLQQTEAGGESSDIDQLDGFTVRIAPDTGIETRFIPFVIMYEGDNIAGIATYRLGDELQPAPILVMPDEIDKYTLTVEKATQINDASLELQSGEVRVVSCPRDDQTSYASGIVWRTSTGEEYRILLPSDGTQDATTRMLDMDCDAHEVTAESSHRDCDDTRSEYNRGAADACDGADTNCDGAEILQEECPGNTATCVSPFGNTGVRVCSEETQVRTQCAPSAYCACQAGVNCHACSVPFEASIAEPANDALVHPCQPVIGTFQTPFCSDLKTCQVDIVEVRGEWKVKISPPEMNLFGSRATGITGPLAVKVEHFDGPTHEEEGDVNNPFVNRPLAEVDLAVTNETGTFFVPLLIRLQEDHSLTCSNATMYCY